MLADALTSGEIFPAYMLYASLHGLSTDEGEVRKRIEAYLNHQPDTQIDEAIYAFEEGKIEAPPDIVLSRWGKSRVYELMRTQAGEDRHQVCERWFDSACRFESLEVVPDCLHFWTLLLASNASPLKERRGARLRLICEREQIQAVRPKTMEAIGTLPQLLTEEIREFGAWGMTFLPVVDGFDLSGDVKLLVCMAKPNVETTSFLDYGARVFNAQRNRC